jgi:hypothetical protein
MAGSHRLLFLTTCLLESVHWTVASNVTSKSVFH